MAAYLINDAGQLSVILGIDKFASCAFNSSVTEHFKQFNAGDRFPRLLVETILSSDTG